MARYTGPKVRLSRKFGEDIFGNTTKRMQGRNQNVRRRKTSEYGIMLAEKQKAKYTYGVLEKQFRNLFDKAAKSSGITGEILLQSLECRIQRSCDDVRSGCVLACAWSCCRRCLRRTYEKGVP